MRISPIWPLSLAAMMGATLPVAAQDHSFSFALRGGVKTTPDYPGASSYGTQPNLGFAFGAVKWGKINIGNGIGDIPDNGLSFRPALKVIRSRQAADNVELAGMTDIDTAVELGLGMTYRQERWMAYGEVRKGVAGHSGTTGTLGADLIFRPDARLTITAGPRVSFGDGNYASTYFGVTAAEAGATGFGAFNAGGGALGAGIAVEATYKLSDVWSFNGLVGYEKLLGDAADSPITLNGSADQWTVRFGLSRAFTLRF